MAQQKIRLTMNIADSEGVKAPATFYGTYTDTLTVAALVGALTTLRDEVAAVTDGQIISCEVAVIAAGAAAPGNFADSDVSQVGTFDFKTSSGRTWADVIPAFADGAIVAGHINLANEGVASLVTALTPAFGDLTSTDRNWLSVVSFADAFLATRKHRRALKRASYEVAV